MADGRPGTRAPVILMDESGRFEKLIRDRLPELIRRSGREPHSRRLDDAAVRPFLAHKLLEEAFDAFDALQDGDREALTGELADLLEVIDRVAHLHGIDCAVIDTCRRQKATARGAFHDNRLLGLAHPEPRRLHAGPRWPLAQVLRRFPKMIIST